MSLLEQLRTEYEASRVSPHAHADVPGFQEINATLRKAMKWLEKASAYLDGLKPPVNHRYDLGYGIVFESPRIAKVYVGQHEQRIVGFPVLDEINIYYEIAGVKPVTVELAPGGVGLVEKILDDAGLQYTSRAVDDEGGRPRRSVLTVPASIPATAVFRPDYKTGLVIVTLVNVDRFERTSLEFESTAIDEPMLEDLVHLMLGHNSAFLRRAPLAGIQRHSTA
jgi:hypothetical protein